MKKHSIKFEAVEARGKATKGFIADMPSPVFVPTSWVTGNTVQIPGEALIDKAYEAARPEGYWKPRANPKYRTQIQRWYSDDGYIQFSTWLKRNHLTRTSHLAASVKFQGDKDALKEALCDATGADTWNQAAEGTFQDPSVLPAFDNIRDEILNYLNAS